MEDIHTTDLKPGVDTNEAFEPISTLDTSSRFRVWSVSTFDKIDDDHHNSQGKLGVFPYSIGSSSFAPGSRKNVKDHLVLVVSMSLRFCLNIWNMKPFKPINV